ncbi:unnamed protein product [Aphanomyces euteiches]
MVRAKPTMTKKQAPKTLKKQARKRQAEKLAPHVPKVPTKRQKLEEAKLAARLPNPYRIEPIVTPIPNECLHFRVNISEPTKKPKSLINGNDKSLGLASTIVLSGETQAEGDFSSLQVEWANTKTIIDFRVSNLSSKVLHALAFLNHKKCVSMSFLPGKATFDIHIPTYMALCDGRDNPSPLTPVPKHMATFMRWLIQQSPDGWSYPYPNEIQESLTDNGAFESMSLYNAIDPTPFSVAGDAYIPSPNLLPPLRRDQKAAVAWMLQREGLLENVSDTESLTTTICATHTSGIAFNPFSAQFYPDGAPLPFDMSNVRGGILADEMGLGKTVQVLACLLSHPSPPVFNSIFPSEEIAMIENKTVRSCVCNSIEDDAQGWVQCKECQVWQHQLCSGYEPSTSKAFYCERCIRRLVPQWSAKSTLIISPQMIHKQWESEVLRHTKPDSLSMMTYSGIKAMRQRLKNQPSKEWMYCRSDILSQFDVVLTTYQAMKDDLYHVVASEDNGLRQRKKYRVVASPLSHMKWWRICMDEAQMVENQNTKASLMAMELNSTLRWCVSGTPFSNSLWDVYGTLAFLRVAPFDEKAWWRAVIMSHSLRLEDILCQIMWRNQKQDVVDQINLPPQKVQRTWLTLSSIESHFYNQQLNECTKHRDTSDLTAGMLNSLLRLRQVCCHPQIGRNGLKAFDESNPMSMNEILAEMLRKAEKECKDAQRQLIGALNGLAGLRVAEKSHDEAVRLYFKAVTLIQTNWADFQADLLPRLHLVFNFGHHLERYCPSNVATPPATDDEEYVHSLEGYDGHLLPDLDPVKHLLENGKLVEVW